MNRMLMAGIGLLCADLAVNAALDAHGWPSLPVWGTAAEAVTLALAVAGIIAGLWQLRGELGL